MSADVSLCEKHSCLSETGCQQMFFVLLVSVVQNICAHVTTLNIKCNGTIVRIAVCYIFDISVTDLLILIS